MGRWVEREREGKKGDNESQGDGKAGNDVKDEGGEKKKEADENVKGEKEKETISWR